MNQWERKVCWQAIVWRKFFRWKGNRDYIPGRRIDEVACYSYKISLQIGGCARLYSKLPICDVARVVAHTLSMIQQITPLAGHTLSLLQPDSASSSKLLIGILTFEVFGLRLCQVVPQLCLFYVLCSWTVIAPESNWLRVGKRERISGRPQASRKVCHRNRRRCLTTFWLELLW